MLKDDRLETPMKMKRRTQGSGSSSNERSSLRSRRHTGENFSFPKSHGVHAMWTPDEKSNKPGPGSFINTAPLRSEEQQVELPVSGLYKGSAEFYPDNFDENIGFPAE